MKENQLLYCKQLLPFSKEFLQNPQDKILYPIYRKMRDFLTGSTTFQDAQHCVVALSGGVDSVALLHLLACYRARQGGAQLSAVHVHHGVRGQQADHDAAMAMEVARLHGLECKVMYAPTQKNHANVSAEAHLRQNRQQAIRQYANTKNNACIATAHHQDDQVETLLHRLFQGSDLVGLQGIQSQTPDGWIRPLLQVPKSELITLAKHRQLPYVTDHTNQQNYITRNKIRNHLLPWLETQLNPSLRQHLLGLRDSIEQHVQDVSSQADQWMAPATMDSNTYRLALFQQATPPVQKQMLQKAYHLIAGKDVSLSREQLRVIGSMIEQGTSGKKYALPKHIGVEIGPGVLIFSKLEENL